MISAAFGLLVLTGGPRRRANVALAAFLFLIAGNQGIESFRRAFPTGAEPAGFYAAGVFAALDPLLLYYFVAVYPRRNALHRSGPLLAVAGTSLLLAMLVGWARQTGIPFALLWLANAVFTAVVYAVCLVFVVRLTRVEPDSAPLRLLHPALAIAAIPAVGRILDPLNSVAAALGWGADAQRLVVGIGSPAGLLFAAGIVAWAARLPEAQRRIALPGAVAGALLMTLALLGRQAAAPFGSTLPILVWISVAIRWVLFSLLVSVAVLRYDMLGMSLAARRRAARTLVAGIILFLAALALVGARSALPAAGLGLTLTEIAILAGVLVASSAFRALVDRVAARVYGVPLPGDVSAALETYRSAALAAAAEGRGVAALVRLRDELGLDARAAAVIESMAFERATPLGAGAVLADRYRIERVLGRGGQATAYLARDQRLDRDVVLKEVLGSGALDALKEARAASALRHPNVLTVHDVVEMPAGAVLVAEFAPGGSLEERVRREGKLDPATGLPLLDSILSGLAAVHARGIVHRDLKPANVLLDERGAPRIADFGLARFQDEATPALGARAVVGTPAFLAPELRRGEPATPASDVYAAGLVARRVLRSPLPAPIEAVLARATAEAPEARYADAGAMREALRAAIPLP